MNDESFNFLVVNFRFAEINVEKQIESVEEDGDGEIYYNRGN